MNKSGTVSIVWSWEDIQKLRPYLTAQQCADALDRISKALHDRSVEEGWVIMKDLLAIHGL